MCLHYEDMLYFKKNLLWDVLQYFEGYRPIARWHIMARTSRLLEKAYLNESIILIYPWKKSMGE